MGKLYKFILIYSLVFYGLYLVTIDSMANLPVTSHDMKAFGERFVDQYMVEIKKNIKDPFKDEFSFYKKRPYSFKATISTMRGASIEFIPSVWSSYQVVTSDLPVSQVLYGSKMFGEVAETYISISKESVNKLGLDWEVVAKKLRGKSWVAEKDPTLLSLKDFKKNKNEISNLLGVDFLRVLPKLGETRTPTLTTEGLRIFGRELPNLILMKGSNERRFWSRKEAINSAIGEFQSDFQAVYLTSTEFRKFVATPELEKICRKIIERNENGIYDDEDGFWVFKVDFEELYSAAKRHNIGTDFADQLYEFLKKQNERRNWFEGHPILNGILWVVVSIIGAALWNVLVVCVKSLWNKFWVKS